MCANLIISVNFYQLIRASPGESSRPVRNPRINELSNLVSGIFTIFQHSEIVISEV